MPLTSKAARGGGGGGGPPARLLPLKPNQAYWAGPLTNEAPMTGFVLAQGTPQTLDIAVKQAALSP